MCATGLVHVPRMCVVGADCAAPVGTGAVRSAQPIRACRETCDCRCSIPFVTALTSTAASEHPVIDGPAVSTRQGYSWCGLRWLGPLARAAWRLSDAIYHCISPFHAVVLLLS